MTPAQFNELQRQADVIEKAEAYRNKLKAYESSGLYLLIKEEALKEFTESVNYKNWKHLHLVIHPSTDEKYKILFHENCLQYQNFITDIFNIGANYGIAFTFNYKNK